MANSTIYNYRFYSKGKSEIDQNDFDYLFENIFEQQDYRFGKLTSYSAPLIFEKDEQNEFIELLIEPYKNVEFLMHIDDIIETNKYDVWIRSMNDGSFIDYISLNNKYGRVCKYKYDKIVFKTNEIFRNQNMRLPFNLEQIGNTGEYTSIGEYHSALSMGRENVKGNFDFTQRIDLSNKLNISLAEYGKLSDCSEWYSDDRVYLFMRQLKYLKGYEKVEFVFNGRTTRIFEGEYMGECYMIDDWDNCIDNEFIRYKKEKNYR